MARRLPIVKPGSLAEMSGSAWSALRKANDDSDAASFICRYGGRMCRLEWNDEGQLAPVVLNQDRLRHRLNQAAQWLGAGGQPSRSVQMDVVRDVLATPNPALPVLTRVVEVPVMAPDGTVHWRPGYSKTSRVFLEPARGLTVRRVPPKPTARQVGKARRLIEREWLSDFPFVSKGERAHAVALLLQPFVRELIDGPTPMYLVEAPTPGSGKTLLIETAHSVVTGRPAAINAECDSEDEWRKRITATLLNAPSLVVIDNVRDGLSSSVLSAALTSQQWSDRRLGHSELVELPNRATWVATGNNPALSGEMARRTARIRLDARMEHPEDRSPAEFRHPDLKAWMRENRGELIWAALTLARAWVVAGRNPAAGSPGLGGFEQWSAVMSGILEVAGIEGFLTNLDAFRENVGSEHEGMYEFLSAWRAQHGLLPVKVRDLDLRVADLAPGFSTSDPNPSRRLGKFLGKHRDRQYGDLRLASRPGPGGVALWFVQDMGGDDG